MSAPPGNTYHHIQISGNARVLLGNAVGQATESTLAARADYTRQYANSSLRPVPTYVPRQRLHQKIKEQLHDQNNNDDEEDDVQILVVWGLGGAGKSQLVLHYIQEYREDYTGVFWIEAGSKETIERDYVQIYRLLYDRQTDLGQGIVKIEGAVPAVKRWFQGREGRWLVVLDSADTIDNDRNKSYIDLNYFMPDAPGLHIIITSRSSAVREITRLEAVEVAEMEPSEAIALFQRAAKMAKAGTEETREINAIVKELGHLALAIALAGSYVSVTPRLSSDIKSYLPEYRQRRKELLQRRPKQHIHRYGESVLSTWEISFKAIENENPVAARLLSLLAFINFEDISISLFDEDCTGVLNNSPRPITEELEAIAPPDRMWRSFLDCGQEWTIYQLESAFETLQRYCLVQWRSDQGSYSMHKLVHAWGQDRLEADRQRQLSGFAIELVANATTRDETSPSYQLRLAPHIMASFGVFSPLYKLPNEVTRGQLHIIDIIGGFLYEIGRWSQAYQLRIFHSVQIERILGKEHPYTLGSMNNLAEVLTRQGSYKEAERIHRQTLALMRTVFSKEPLYISTSMNNLAVVLSRQGSYEEAERIHRQALALREEVLGKEHPDVLGSMNNLAEVLSSQESYEEAERIHRQALTKREMVLGKEHPDTLGSMNNLAEVLNMQGSYEGAERIYRQVLTGSEAALGKEHPDTLTSMNNLGLVLSNQGKYKEAERIQRQTLALSETLLGKKHPSTLTSMNNLGLVLSFQGNYKEAERIQRQILALSETLLGKTHPFTLTSMNNLAAVLESQGKYEEAEGIYR